MQRFLMADLLEWKDSPHRKPLVLNGARQVGKTWLLQELGKTAFKNVAYVSFDNNPQLASLFDNGYDLAQILLGIQAESRQKITQEETLIIFDEIQECPKALTSLKYFYEQMPGQAIAAAGSLLGITIHEGTGYPVGKVTTLDLYPLSFREFLDATNESALRELVDSGDWKLIDSFKEKLTSLLRQYYFIGVL